MAANTSPIYTLTPNIGTVGIPTATAQIKSDGTSAGVSTDFVYKVFTSGSAGSYVDRVRFQSVASAAAVTGVATTLRVYLSTIASPGATSNTDTWLLGEVSVPAVASSNSINATNYYDIILNMAIPTGRYIHVSQHVAQTTNQRWNAICFGGDY